MAATAARLARIRGSLTPREWWRVGGMVGFIIGLYVVGWGVFIVAILPEHSKFLGIGVAVTAYTLGLRHAFDADHISAIDNTTRKLMSEGKRPLSVGFWFSLGHSSVVFGLGVGLTFAARAIISQVSNSNSTVETFGGIIGTLVSGTFLYLIAILNLIVLVGIVKVFVEMRRGRYNDEELEQQLNARGLMTRFFGKLMRSIRSPWQMYPVGVVFGLGFDTATGRSCHRRVALVRGAEPADPLRRWHGDPRHARRIVYELRLRMGVLEAGAQGLLQHHHHRALGRRGDVDRHHRDLRTARRAAQSLRRVLGLHGELQHQRGRVHHRRAVRPDLGGRPRHLALRPHRATLGASFGATTLTVTA